MSFDPRDYEGVTFDDEHGYTEARERAEREAECREGNHVYRLQPGSHPENPQYRCEDCGSTDPEGDSAVDAAVKGWRRSYALAIRESEAA